MDDLTAFLTARLDEDEAMVAEPHIWPTTFRPERVLRDVEAGRQLLSDYEEARTGAGATALVIERILFMQIVNRVRVWSDHPDYRPEWKP